MLLVLNRCIKMIKARNASCEFILLRVIEFKYIRQGVILRSIILYLKICQVCDNQLSFFNFDAATKEKDFIQKKFD